MKEKMKLLLIIICYFAAISAANDSILLEELLYGDANSTRSNASTTDFNPETEPTLPGGVVTENSVSKLEELEKVFYESCPLAVSRNLPLEFALNMDSFEMAAIDVNINVMLHRVIDIDDLAQTMSVFMEITLSWGILCSNIDFQGTALFTFKQEELNRILITANSSDMWYPKLVHSNAAEDAYPFDKMAAVTEFRPFTGVAHKTYAGTIVSSCDGFSFRLFPYDTMSCNMDFDIVAPSYLYRFSEINVDRSSDLTGDTDIWSFLPPPIAQILVIPRPSDRAQRTTRARFGLQFRRKASYYGPGIFLPVVTLFILQVLALFIEPNAPDRAAFMMTVVLSFAVVLTLVFSSIPKTSEEVYLVNLIEVKLIVSVLLTIYALIMQPLADYDWATKTYYIPGEKRRFKLRVSVVRTIDFGFGFVSALAVAVCYGVYLDRMMHGKKED